jgi:hypothetical protein
MPARVFIFTEAPPRMRTEVPRKRASAYVWL